ncbi:unnamed protein product [Camellia sinensis]
MEVRGERKECRWGNTDTKPTLGCKWTIPKDVNSGLGKLFTQRAEVILNNTPMGKLGFSVDFLMKRTPKEMKDSRGGRDSPKPGPIRKRR